VTITGASVSPDNPAWRESFVELQQKGGIVRFSCAIDGSVYAKHGTTFDTRLTVIDKVPITDVDSLPPSMALVATSSDLLEHVIAHVPPRAVVSGAIGLSEKAKPVAEIRSFSPIVRKPQFALVSTVRTMPTAASTVELAYEAIAEADMSTKVDLTDALYEGYTLRSIRIPNAKPHPTILVQSTAMASVAPPVPTYRPHLPERLMADNVLSDAQIESVIYAGEAHVKHLAGSWVVDESFDNISAAAEDSENAVRFRRGWFLGDGTGCGKGRQVAGIMLDNWIKGRRKAVWISGVC